MPSSMDLTGQWTSSCRALVHLIRRNLTMDSAAVLITTPRSTTWLSTNLQSTTDLFSSIFSPADQLVRTKSAFDIKTTSMVLNERLSSPFSNKEWSLYNKRTGKDNDPNRPIPTEKQSLSPSQPFNNAPGIQPSTIFQVDIKTISFVPATIHPMMSSQRRCTATFLL